MTMKASLVPSKAHESVPLKTAALPYTRLQPSQGFFHFDLRALWHIENCSISYPGGKSKYDISRPLSV